MSQTQTSNPASSSGSFAPPRKQDSRGVEKLLGDFVSAWNRHDPAQMAAAWAEDGDLITPYGRQARGRKEVQQVFTDEHNGPFKNCSHQMDVSDVRWISDEVAIVDATCNLTGVRDEKGQEMPPFKPHVTFVISRKGGEARVSAARPYAFVPLPGQSR